MCPYGPEMANAKQQGECLKLPVPCITYAYKMTGQTRSLHD